MSMTNNEMTRTENWKSSCFSESVTQLQSPNPDCLCSSCGQSCLEVDHTLVRALNQVYHHNSSACKECQCLATNKLCVPNTAQFSTDIVNKRVLCKDPHSKLDLSCPRCSRPLVQEAGSATRFYCHAMCRWCIQCTIDKTPNRHSQQTEMYYEYDRQYYCHYHFSMIPNSQCTSCSQAILYKCVESVKYPNKKWHPKCYMIFKFWNVCFTDLFPSNTQPSDSDQLKKNQTTIEKKIDRIWTDLSAFEESSATCISDMLLAVAEGNLIKGVQMANHFVNHLHMLFTGLDTLNDLLVQQNLATINCEKEADIVCKQVLQFFNLLTQQNEGRISNKASDKHNVTQDLLPLVTGLAQNLKSLIRIGLTEALKLEYVCGIQAISSFLKSLAGLDNMRVWIAGRYYFKDAPLFLSDIEIARMYSIPDNCKACSLPIHDKHVQKGSNRWHTACFACKVCQRKLGKNLTKTREIGGTETFLFYFQCCTSHDNQGALCLVTPLIQQTMLLQTTLVSVYQSLCQTNLSKEPEKSPFKPSCNSSQELKIKKDINSPTKDSDKSGCVNTQHIAGVARRNTIRLGRIDEDKTATNNPTEQSGIKRASTLHEGSPKEAQRRNSARRRITRTSSIHSMSCKHPSDTLNTPDHTFDGSNGRQYFQGIFDQKKHERRCSFNLPLSPITSKHLFVNTMVYSDCIIKHAAILHFGSFRVPNISQESLIGLVEYKKSSVWGRILTHFRGISSSSRTTTDRSEKANFFNPPTITFKVPLSELVARIRPNLSSETVKGDGLTSYPPNFAPYLFNATHIPLFVQHCIIALFQTDLTTEGIFRKNGNIRELKFQCDAIDGGKPLSEVMDKASSIQLGAMLKSWLRQLPEPLLTFKLYDLFLASSRIENTASSKEFLHLVCCLLPKENRDTMQLVFMFLHWVSTFSDDNKMNIHNLARVIAPSVFYSRTSSKNSHEQNHQSANDGIRVVEMMIMYQEDLRKIPFELVKIMEEPKLVGYVKEHGMDFNSKSFLKICHSKLTGAKFQPMDMGMSTLTSASNVSCQNTLETSFPGDTQIAMMTPLKRVYQKGWIMGKH
ncbi:hypothetical protein J3Q64DRAFT_1822765 [Phycomyces blakesleeanus]|uniref:Rho-GAP domain-containing protein n=1 Tax=Phycomyces blakesleeanus TaxID=4837 RepID=A0ABR3AVQ2_PHYBL